MPYENAAENLGRPLLAFLEEVGNLTQLAKQVLQDIFHKKVKAKLTYDQMIKIGVESLPLALVTSGFIGMVFAVQIAGEFLRFGAGKYVGGVMSIGVARELGPSITGIVVAARVAAAITAEIGTMQVKEQIDALKALGVSPIRYLVVPRFIAAALMIPLLTVLADLTAFVGGYCVAVYGGNINSVEYMENAQRLMSLWDIFGGIIKTFFFGMLIALIASYKGLNTRGGAKGVGEATTASVVATLLTLFVVNYFLSVLFFK